MCKTVPFRRELNKDDLLRMKIPKRYWDMKFEYISDESVHNDEVDEDLASPREVVKKYLAKLEDMRKNGVGLLLWGKNGTGKTAAAVVVANIVGADTLSCSWSRRT